MTNPSPLAADVACRRAKRRPAKEITSKAELLQALLLERYGPLHPEYRPTAEDTKAAVARRDLIIDDLPGTALRLIADNTPPTPEPLDRTGTENP